MNLESTEYRAALYMRLSKDDNGASESSSITTQRKMLLSYAKENSFSVYDEYIDDGWSGTNFDRPNFKRMIQDVEEKKVNLIITKDLSRLGRDYIIAGQYTEIYFPAKGVRYIAINDGYDSDSPYTDIAPFKNIINEMYARDTSKKIRSAFITKMESGKFIGNFAPYGYKKDPDNKNHLILDKETSPIVHKMFELAAEGETPTKIARYLNDKGVSSPAMYRCRNCPYLNIEEYSKRKEWTSATVSKMLRSIVYLGHLAQGKTTKVSFKNHITIQNQKKAWIVVKDTHEPIVSSETYDIVRRRILSRTCHQNGTFVNIFSGIAKCKDCGRNMSAVGTRKKGSVANLVCGGYKLYGRSECCNHFIDYDTLYNIVLEAVREQVKVSEQEKQELLEELQIEVKASQEEEIKNKELEKLNKRNSELDGIIEKIYEDNFHGVIEEGRFRKLLAKYEEESKKICKQIEMRTIVQIQNKQDVFSIRQINNKLSDLIKEYMDIQILTPDLLFKLIDRIEISQGSFEKVSSGKVKHQTIQIYFRFIGTITMKQYIL